MGGVGGGSSVSSSWYILYAHSPLTFRQRFLDFKPAFEEFEGHTFYAEVRTPNEFVSKESSPGTFTSTQARRYLFRYVFVCTDNLDALQRLLTHPDAALDARLLHPHHNGDRLVADTIPAAEIDRFFLFCRAYTLYAGTPDIPFIELDATSQAGASVLITAGPYKGISARIAPSQEKVPEGHTAVLVSLMGDLGVALPIPDGQLRIVSPAPLASNKYAPYDAFFAFFTQPEATHRLLAATPTEEDIAKALRMRALAGTIKTDGPRAQRDSRRLQYLKASALLICHRILQHPEAAHPLLPLWRSLKSGTNDDTLRTLIDTLYKKYN